MTRDDLPRAYRSIIRGLADSSEAKRMAARDKLDDLEIELDERQAVALLRATLALELPAPEDDGDDGDDGGDGDDGDAPLHDLLFKLVANPHAELVPIARAAYPKLAPREQCAVLALLGAVGTRAAAAAFMDCVRAGWPRAYSRVFTEARKLAPHAEIVFPELVERAGANVAGVTHLLVDGLATGEIDPARVNLEPLAPLVMKSLRGAQARAAKHERARGIDWRFSEKYAEPRREAAAWLEVAGHLRSRSFAPLLARGLASRDPHLALVAASSILRRGGRVSPQVLERVAACHETRAPLFSKLEGLGRLAHFPAAWRTWDAFAMGHMVEWLVDRAELGRAPDEIEQAAVFTEKRQAMYVYRFRDGRRWHAGVAGPFVRRGQPRPLHGAMTFSQFDAWNSATPEGHLGAIVKTLKAWARSG